MPLTVHHLQVSQSERIPWLCEELAIPYELVLHHRDPIFSPPSIKALNPLSQAPVIQDGAITIAESGACAEYIAHKYGNGRLTLPPSHKDYADYLYWFHFANGSLQPVMLTLYQLSRYEDVAADTVNRLKERFGNMLSFVDKRVGANEWLAGDEFTLADITILTTFTTMRAFYGYSLEAYPQILKYLKRATDREAFKKARAKGDPDLELGIEGKPPASFIAKLRAEGKI